MDSPSASRIRLMSQSLLHCEGFPVDILRIGFADGTERAVYFTIKIVMEEEPMMLGIK